MQRTLKKEINIIDIAKKKNLNQDSNFFAENPY